MARSEAPRETAAPMIFHCRLIPPRPDFAFTMTEDERALMGQHADYLRGRLRDGTMIMAGPVADPAGPWGLLILRVGSEAGGKGRDGSRPCVALGPRLPL